jgi:hypothetical protein
VRKFLLTVFWITSVGGVIQLLIIASATWIIFSGNSSFFDLTVNVFVTQFAPWLSWVKALIVTVLGDFGRWILAIPILIIAPLKLLTGTIIGVWAYTVAKDMPVEPPHM